MRAARLPVARAASLQFSFLLLLSFWLDRGVGAKELQFATVVFRHGDRSPIQTFPNDPIKESSWPDGFGQLTQLGMVQQYELGNYLRTRYENFLNEFHKHQEVYIRSTDADRTLMSAVANLEALFPSEANSARSPRLPWLPVPVHTIPLSEDQLLYLPFRNCPRYEELLHETLLTEEFQKRWQPYKDFIEMLPTLTGIQIKDLFSIWSEVYDPLLCEYIHNFTLPSWVTEDTMIKLKELSELSLLSIYGIHKQKEKSRLQGGVLLGEIFNHIKRATQPSNKRKLVMYSAHDTTVSGLQMALDVYNGLLPPYAACHMMELYLDNGTYFVEMYYRNETQHKPYPLTLPGCTPSCPLTEFTKLVDPVIPHDWSKECKITSKHQVLRIILAIAFCFVSGVLVVLLFILIRHGPCGRRDSYQNI